MLFKLCLNGAKAHIMCYTYVDSLGIVIISRINVVRLCLKGVKCCLKNISVSKTPMSHFILTLVPWVQGTLTGWEESLNTIDLLVQTGLDELLFALKIFFYLFTHKLPKQGG